MAQVTRVSVQRYQGTHLTRPFVVSGSILHVTLLMQLESCLVLGCYRCNLRLCCLHLLAHPTQAVTHQC